MSQVFLERLLRGDMSPSVEHIKSVQAELPRDRLNVSKAIPDDEGVRPPTYTVGLFPSDDHHAEDTIAEFWDGNHDGKAWAQYFAAAPEMIDYLLKQLDKTPKKNRVDKALFKLANDSTLTCKVSDISAVLRPPPNSDGYVIIYLKDRNDGGYALDEASAEMFFKEFPEWTVE